MTELLLLVAGVAIGVLATYVLLRPSSRGISKAPSPEQEPHPGPLIGDSEAPAPSWEILDQIAEGVLLLDERLRPVLANAAAGRILGFQGQDPPSRLPSEEVVVVARRCRDERSEIEELLYLWYPSRSTLKARAVPVEGSQDVLLILQDVTEEFLSQKIRREFVAHASHELKSPVASLQTLAEAVGQAAADDPEAVGRFSQKMVAEAARMGQLIHDLLDLSRLEDPVTIPDDPIDLSEIAEREMQQARSVAIAKNMRFNSDIEPGVWVKGDDQQLSLMIRNLLENAIRYTPELGTIGLRVRRSENTALVSVTDTGIGIPLEAQGRVFERFYRVDRAHSHARGGTGLGLAIVKHVAELHGGEVALQSELGEGSTFTTQLPAISAGPNVTSLAG